MGIPPPKEEQIKTASDRWNMVLTGNKYSRRRLPTPTPGP